MNVLETVKVSSRGQIVIPESMRRDLQIQEGTKLIVIEENGQIVIEKEPEFLKKLAAQKEKSGWKSLSEKTLEKTWKNKKDGETWEKY